MAASRGSDAPAIRIRTPEGTAKILRAHFARHNWQVVFLAIGTLVVSLAAWGLLYFICTWMISLAIPIFDLPYERVPHRFWILFLVTAVCGLALAWLDHWLSPDARPYDKKHPFEVLQEILLTVPNLTLAVGGTLRAWQSLSDAELLGAAELLHRLGREKRIPLSSVRMDIPDPDAAVRVLFALQMIQVIDAHRDGSEFWLRLNALRPANLRMNREETASG
jgi:hypothetical protein